MRNRKRLAFTLIELLVVITIIGILVGLLVPAVWSAVRRGRQAQAESQVNILAQALAAFNSKHGFYPPSRLVFHESGYLGEPPDGNLYFAGFGHAEGYVPIGGRPDGPAAGSVEHRELVARSVADLRRMFPRMNVSTEARQGRDPLGPNGTIYDINGDGIGQDAPILLDGHECLFLFLCGMPDWDGQPGTGYELRGPAGFDINPRNPFVRPDPLTPAGRRTSPYFEVANPGLLSDDDRDGIPGLLDPIGQSSDARYVAYFAPTAGHYDPRDVRFEDEHPGRFFFRDAGGNLDIPGPNPWATSPTWRADGEPVTIRWHRPQSYQLVSPGNDRLYGPGGEIMFTGGQWTYPDGREKVEEDNAALR